MDTKTLLNKLNIDELTYEATELVVWNIGAASNEEDVAKFMYRGGPFPPQNSMNTQRPPNDPRPDKQYWHFVKKEMHVFLCTSDRKYRELWQKIKALQKKSTTTIVALIASYLGASIGVAATLLSGFVAVCLYAAIKLGKEAYCSYVASKA